MMHCGRPIFRLLDDVTAPTLCGDGGIMSTLQQRHPGFIDLTPLHPISAAARIAPVQEHNTKTTCVHLHKVPPVWRASIGLLSLSLFVSLFFSISLPLFSARLICVIHCVRVCTRVISHWWPRGRKGVGRKKMERRSSPFSLEEFFKATSLRSHIASSLSLDQLINNGNIECGYWFGQFRASLGIYWFAK